jgi:hypothetical protein
VEGLWIVEEIPLISQREGPCLLMLELLPLILKYPFKLSRLLGIPLGIEFKKLTLISVLMSMEAQYHIFVGYHSDVQQDIASFILIKSPFQNYLLKLDVCEALLLFVLGSSKVLCQVIYNPSIERNFRFQKFQVFQQIRMIIDN